MQLLTARRRAFSALTALTVAAALAGCGGDDAPKGGSGSASTSGSDGAALLKDGFLNVALGGETITSGSFAMKVTGSVDLPNDDELKRVEGTASITGSVDKNTDKSELPPLTVRFDVDGSYVDGNSKSAKGAYKGGVTFVDNAFYANWDGTEYAVGTELSKQLLAEISKTTAGTTGAGSSSALGGYDAQQIIDAMQLDAGTWVKDPKVEDGGEIDGVETSKVSGAVDAKSVVSDITDGLRKLPAAVPNLPGVKQLESVSGASEADIADLEKAITKLDLALWVGKDDKVQRRMTLDIGIDTKEDGDPIKADILIDVTTTKLNQPQNIAAPKDAQPITDLILKLQSEFSALFGGGGAAVGPGSGA